MGAQTLTWFERREKTGQPSLSLLTAPQNCRLGLVLHHSPVLQDPPHLTTRLWSFVIRELTPALGARLEAWSWEIHRRDVNTETLKPKRQGTSSQQGKESSKTTEPVSHSAF